MGEALKKLWRAQKRKIIKSAVAVALLAARAVLPESVPLPEADLVTDLILATIASHGVVDTVEVVVNFAAQWMRRRGATDQARENR